MLNDNQKRALYESIMKDVAKVVKKHLNKLSESEEKSNNSFVKSFILSLSKMNESNLIKLKRTFRHSLNESVQTATEMIINGQSSIASIPIYSNDNAEITRSVKVETIYDVSSAYSKVAEIFNETEQWPFINCVSFDDVEFLDIIIPKSIEEDFVQEMRNQELYPKDMTYEIQKFIDVITKISNDTNVIDIIKSDEFKKEVLSWVYIRFMPIEQPNIRQDLLSNELYHYTLEEYVDDIKKNGIIPANIAHPTYPPRVFLVTPERDRTTIQRMRMIMMRSGINNIPFNLETYTTGLVRSVASHIVKSKGGYKNLKFKKITIDLNKIPSNIEFHWDMNSIPFGVYTESVIPASAITNIENYDFKIL